MKKFGRFLERSLELVVSVLIRVAIVAIGIVALVVEGPVTLAEYFGDR